MSDLARFQAWLVDHEQLSKTTARKAASDVRTMREHGPSPPASQQLAARLKDYRYAWALYADFCEAEERTCTLPEPPRPAAPPPSHRARRKKREPKRLREAVSIPIEQWKAFLHVVEEDPSPPARVVDVMCSSALRIADVLRTPFGVLVDGFKRDDGICTIVVKNGKDVVYSVIGAELQWQQLLSAAKQAKMRRSQLVAELVSPGSDWTADSAAYQRCRRKLHDLAIRAGIEDRVHLHRLRRTVAVQVAASTGNTWLVQKMLSHEHGSTTKTYLDETFALEVARALQEHNKKMRG